MNKLKLYNNLRMTKACISNKEEHVELMQNKIRKKCKRHAEYYFQLILTGSDTSCVILNKHIDLM
jgi:hypothetical protein